MTEERVVIVGGGVIGLCCAWYAVRRGMSVTILEREQLDSEGCSFGNAGMIVPSHFVPLAAPGMVRLGIRWMRDPESPFYIKPQWSWDLLSWGLRFCQAATPERVAKAEPLLRDLNLRSRELYIELADQSIDFGLEKRGLLMLCKDAKTLEEESHSAEKAVRLGIPAEVLDAGQVQRLDPQVTYSISGAVYFPLDCHLHPQKFMAQMEERLRQSGVRFLRAHHVHQWRIEKDRIRGVESSFGTVEGDRFVLAAGVWSSLLSKQLRLSLPMQSGKGYSVTLEHPAQLPSICSILTEARIAVTPIGNRLRFGGTMEIGGLHGNIQARRVQGIIKSIPHYLPSFDPRHFHNVTPWFGHRPCSPDGLPYVGKSSRWRNLWIATGHAMMGLSLAPVTGELIAELLEHGQTKLDIQLLSPNRYG